MTGESLILADLLTEGLARDTVVAREGLETLSSSLPALENSGGGAMVETVQNDHWTMVYYDVTSETVIQYFPTITCLHYSNTHDIDILLCSIVFKLKSEVLLEFHSTLVVFK